jgi:hypothetical protein
MLPGDSITAQSTARGRVFDSSGTVPLEGVSVMSSSGRGTSTASNGYYELPVRDTDFIWFSYLGKETAKYPAAYVLAFSEFTISIQISVPLLQEVKIRTPDYRYDSVMNRFNYARIFSYQRPSLRSIVRSISITGISIDIDELIKAFQVKKIHARLSFQHRLIEEEKNKFIDRRFNRHLVKQLTGLEGEELNQFMIRNRPAYDFVLSSSDYELRKYIKNCNR